MRRLRPGGVAHRGQRRIGDRLKRPVRLRFAAAICSSSASDCGAAPALRRRSAARAARARPTASSRAISTSLSRSPSGGISSPSYLHRRDQQALVPALPATAAGPLSPPFKIASREVSFSPPLGSGMSPWHL